MPRAKGTSPTGGGKGNQLANKVSLSVLSDATNRSKGAVT
jgi:hypothetical protein